MPNYKVEENVIIRPDVKIGNRTVLKCGVVLATGTIVGDDCFFSPYVVTLRGTPDGKSYPVKIGNNVFIGAGSIINPGVSICDDVVIGSGSVVTENIIKPGTYVGSPVRKVR